MGDAPVQAPGGDSLMRVLVLAFLFACVSPVEPSRRIVPPPAWKQAADWVWEHCASKVRERPIVSFNRIQFYAVDGEVVKARGERWVGYWIEDRIYLTLPALADPKLLVVKHELLHAMTGMAHSADWYQRPGTLFWDCWVKAEGEHGGT